MSVADGKHMSAAAADLAPGASLDPSAWRRAGGAALALLALVLVLYHATLASMGEVWLHSDTFAHGAIVFPVGAWLAWRRRAALAAVAPRTSVAGLTLLAALAAGWLLAQLAGVRVAEQLAVVAMVPAIVLAVLGPRVLAILAFPLGFLVFAVPFGEGLIPALMEFTADFTVRALELTGIPVYRDGLHFSIPSGDFEVARACSGIRYLIASVALGTLYAQLTYRALWRRALFVALALVVPLVANGVRAWLIVMIAHWSDMRLAVGVDHLVYGWLFFGLVMFALFWVGLAFRERTPPAAPSPATARGPAREGAHGLGPAVLAAAVLSAAPLAARQLATAPLDGVPAPALPAAVPGWRGPDAPALAWQPVYAGAAHERLAAYADAVAPVQVAVVVYGAQAQGTELINAGNALYDEPWRLVDSGRADAAVAAGGAPLAVRATRLHGPAGPLLVWHWYAVGEHATASAARAKLQQAWDAARGTHAGAVLVALATPEEPDASAADARLRAFVAEHGAALMRCVRGAAAGCSP